MTSDCSTRTTPGSLTSFDYKRACRFSTCPEHPTQTKSTVASGLEPTRPFIDTTSQSTEPLMEPDPSRVIVSGGATAHTTEVHHRDFSEIRADGGSAKDAAAYLANKLAAAPRHGPHRLASSNSRTGNCRRRGLREKSRLGFNRRACGLRLAFFVWMSLPEYRFPPGIRHFLSSARRRDRHPTILPWETPCP